MSTTPPPAPSGSPLLDSYEPVRYPPYVTIPEVLQREIATAPNIGLFQVPAPGEQVIRSYRIRVRRPKFPWALFLAGLVLWVVPGLIVLVGFFLSRRRGHTFLYVTNRRVVIVELTQGLFYKAQTIENFDLSMISGFTLLAQRGLKRLLGLIRLKEKRTFYLAIVTKTLAQVQIGAINSRGSQFDPGQDAVKLCSELDSLVLGLKARA